MAQTVEFKDAAYGKATGSGVNVIHSVIRYAGWFSSVGGSATQVFTVPGVLATDKVTILPYNTAHYVLSAVCSADTVTFICEADPGNSVLFDYMIFRAV